MMGIGQDLDMDDVTIGMALLIPAHGVAQISAFLRIIVQLRAEEPAMALWRRATSWGSFLIHIVQLVYLVFTFSDQGDEDVFILSLSALMVLDIMGAGCGPALGPPGVEYQPGWMVQVAVPDTTTARIDVSFFKKGDARISVGSRSFAEQPCHVCLEDMDEGAELGELRCGHIFHAQCIQDWLARGRGCPLRCREALRTDSEEEEVAQVPGPATTAQDAA